MHPEEGDNADDTEGNVDYEINGAGTALILMALTPKVFRGISGGTGAETANTTAPHALHGQALADVRAAGTDYSAFVSAMTAEYPNWFPALEGRWGHKLHSFIVGQPGSLPIL